MPRRNYPPRRRLRRFEEHHEPAELETTDLAALRLVLEGKASRLILDNFNQVRFLPEEKR